MTTTNSKQLELFQEFVQDHKQIKRSREIYRQIDRQRERERECRYLMKLYMVWHLHIDRQINYDYKLQIDRQKD